jgi:ATP-dependent Clp protease ATP-binding subunit ClpA
MADSFGSYAGRVDERARRALAYADEEAQRLEHNYVGTEHLLLGLLRDEQGAAGRLLRRLGVELEETREAVTYWTRDLPAELVGRGGAESVPLARRVKAALDAALAHAKARGANAASQDDLLRALVGASDKGVAAIILEGFGVTSERVEAERPNVPTDEQPGSEHPYALAVAGKLEEATRSVATWRETRRRQGRRYSLVLPDDLFRDVEALAERQHTTVVELLRRFTRLGLIASQLQERPDAALIIREGGTERQLLLL